MLLIFFCDSNGTDANFKSSDIEDQQLIIGIKKGAVSK